MYMRPSCRSNGCEGSFGDGPTSLEDLFVHQHHQGPSGGERPLCVVS